MTRNGLEKESFKEADHPAMVLANKGIGVYFPNLNLIYIDLQKDDRVEFL